LCVGAFDESSQTGFYRGAAEELAEDVYFFQQFFMGDGLDEFLGGDGGVAIEFFQLGSSDSGEF
jgi:hypothetical protein